MISEDSISFVLMGHVDSGKSTLAGQILYLNNEIPKKHMDDIENLSYEMGKSSFKYAWLMTSIRIQRQRGITIVNSFKSIKLKQRRINLIDVSGHRDFLKNAMAGIAMADVGILVVCASSGQYQAGISKQGRTRDHIVISKAKGISQMIVCINKMDVPHENLPKYSQKRYNEIKKQITQFLLQVGFKQESITFIPITAYLGENITKKSQNMEWYEGPTLWDKMTSTKLKKQKQIVCGLRMPIQQAYKVSGIGTVVIGRVESGSIKSGTKVKLEPKGIELQVKSIQEFHTTMTEAKNGISVGVNLRNISVKQIRRGNTLVSVTDNFAYKCFTAHIVLYRKMKLKVGSKMMISCHVDLVECEIIEDLTQKPDKTSQKPYYVFKMMPIRPLCCDTISVNPRMAKLVLLADKLIIGVGTITQVQ